MSIWGLDSKTHKLCKGSNKYSISNGNLTVKYNNQYLQEVDLLSNYNGLLYIFDRNEKLLNILNNEASKSNIFFDDEFKKELNGEWSYKFSVDMSKTNDIMLEYNKVGFYDRRGNFQLF